MGQSCLEYFIILHAHKQHTDDLDICEVAKDFASKDDHRQDYFEHFLGSS